ncbi:MAG: DUF177 domain-containing protein [Mailhella sp.]|nr:DUF177 domain-containing protein [Mailhella sp.]
MELDRIALNSLPAQGMELTVTSDEVWAKPLGEYGINCRIAEPVSARVFILAQDTGCLIRGDLSGTVVLPCNRCMEDTVVRLAQEFEEFEEYPWAEREPEDTENAVSFMEDGVVFQQDGMPFLDLASLLWEEFSLALPVKPLCRQDCKGLCPVCGKNLNQGDCGCTSEAGDPRLAALRRLKVKRQA